MMELNNWYTHMQSVSSVLDDPFKAPQQVQPAIGISGTVTGHPDFEDGDEIITSKIIDVYEHDGDVYVRTFSGSLYKLLEPKASYEQYVLNAKQRLVDTFKNAKCKVSHDS
jgi:hypothetical protein